MTSFLLIFSTKSSIFRLFSPQKVAFLSYFLHEKSSFSTIFSTNLKVMNPGWVRISPRNSDFQELISVKKRRFVTETFSTISEKAAESTISISKNSEPKMDKN